MVRSEFQLFTTIRCDPLLSTHSVNSNLASNAAASSPRSSSFYMLRYHRDRLLKASRYFGWAQAIKAIEGENGMEYFRLKLDDEITLQFPCEGPDNRPSLRVKVILNYDGMITVETGITSSIDLYNLYPDNLSKIAEINTDFEPTENNSSPTLFSLQLSQVQTQPSPHTRHKTTQRCHYDLVREKAGIKMIPEPREVLLVNSRGEIMEGSLTSVYFRRFGVWVTPCLESGGQDGTTRSWALDMGLCIESVITATSLIEDETCCVSNGLRGFQKAKLRFWPESALKIS